VGRISWFEITGRDPARLQSFYSQLFGWKINTDRETQYGIVSAADAGVDGGIGPDPEGGPGSVTVYVGVDDINAAMAKVGQLGGKTVMEPTELADLGVIIALFEDPAGHVIGMTQDT
jgi:predicted enzyme related to lactoylglutathione lyase